MKSIRFLLLIGLVTVLAAGCLGAVTPGPSKPTDPKPEPGPIYDHETPGYMVVEVSGESEGQGIAPMSVASTSEDDPTHIAHVLIELIEPPYGPTIYSVTRAVPYDPAVGLELPEEVPSGKGYVVNVTTRIADTTTFEQFGVVPDVAVPGLMSTTVDVPLFEPTYQLDAPTEMYSGGGLSAFQLHKEDDNLTRTLLFGLNPWDTNGTSGLWAANGTPGNITGWLDTGILPEVTTETPLYYQVRICTLARYSGGENICRHFPDVEANEPLFTVPIYPKPEH